MCVYFITNTGSLMRHTILLTMCQLPPHALYERFIARNLKLRLFPHTSCELIGCS